MHADARAPQRRDQRWSAWAGLRTFALIVGLWGARGLAAQPFHHQWFNGGAERLLFVPEGQTPPPGWNLSGFDDSAWTGPVQYVGGGWLVHALARSWSSYAWNGPSQHQDDLLVRLSLDLPAGLAQASAQLDLVVDDNAQIWLNGRPVFADRVTDFVAIQPRRVGLAQGWRPCDNLLAMKVRSVNPTSIGYKFALTLDGQVQGGLRCGEVAPPPQPEAAATPAVSAASSPVAAPVASTPTSRPSPTVAGPTPTPRPTRAPLRPSPTPGSPTVGGVTARPSPTPPCPPPPAPGKPRWVLSNRPRVLARAGRFRLDAGHVRRQLFFTLTATTRVWAEAAGLWGQLGQGQGDAPEAFFDDSYAGPLEAEAGGAWRSPRAFVLGPGPHRLLLRASSLGPAAPSGGTGLTVLSDPVARLEAAPRPTPCGCPAAPLGRGWPRRLGGRPLVLSVHSGRVQSAGTLVRLRDRDGWECRVRLPAPGGQPLAVVASVRSTGPGAAQLVLALDPTYRGPAAALGYTPNRWEPLRLGWCQGRLTVRLARAPAMVVALPPGPLALALAAQDLELGLAPAR